MQQLGGFDQRGINAPRAQRILKRKGSEHRGADAGNEYPLSRSQESSGLEHRWQPFSALMSKHTGKRVRLITNVLVDPRFSQLKPPIAG